MQRSARDTQEQSFRTDPRQHEALGYALTNKIRDHIILTGDLDALPTFLHRLWMSRALGVNLGFAISYYVLRNLASGEQAGPEVVSAWPTVRTNRKVKGLFSELQPPCPWINGRLSPEAAVRSSALMAPLHLDVDTLQRDHQRRLKERLNTLDEVCCDPHVELGLPEEVLARYLTEAFRLLGQDLARLEVTMKDVESIEGRLRQRVKKDSRAMIGANIPSKWTATAAWLDIPLDGIISTWLSDLDAHMTAAVHRHATRGQASAFVMPVSAGHPVNTKTWNECRKQLALSGVMGAAGVSGAASACGALAGGVMSSKTCALAKAASVVGKAAGVVCKAALPFSAGGVAVGAVVGLGGWAWVRLSKAQAAKRFGDAVEGEIELLGAARLEAFALKVEDYLRQRTVEQSNREVYLLAIMQGEALDRLCVELAERVEQSARAPSPTDA